MKLLILSDLHLELWREQAPRIDVSLSKPDVVILAGDISTGTKAVEWAAQAFANLPVVYVAENHEAYGDTLVKVEVGIREATTTHPQVHFRNCDEYVLGNVRFLGCTLWTDFQLFGDDTRLSAMVDAQAAMNDYRRIRRARDYRKLQPSDTARIHALHKSWLTRKLAEPFEGKTVVVTHMAPSMKSVAERYAGDLVSAAFASNRSIWLNRRIYGYMAICMTVLIIGSGSAGSSVIHWVI